MFLFGSAAATHTPQFVPNPEARTWIAESLVGLYRSIQPTSSSLITATPQLVPRDLDGLFELICTLQEDIGQHDVVFSLQEGGSEGPQLPSGYAPLGDPQGHLLHTFARAGEYVLVYLPQIFRVPELLLAAVARELGRIAIDRCGEVGADVAQEDREGFVELAAVVLGMGVWVANGAYLFEQKCCGGGCGVDLRSVRAGLSMPEASFALAIDGLRRGNTRRGVGKALAATQKAAFKESWKWIERSAPETLALVAGPASRGLPGLPG